MRLKVSVGVNMTTLVLIYDTPDLKMTALIVDETTFSFITAQVVERLDNSTNMICVEDLLSFQFSHTHSFARADVGQYSSSGFRK